MARSSSDSLWCAAPTQPQEELLEKEEIERNKAALKARSEVRD